MLEWYQLIVIALGYIEWGFHSFFRIHCLIPFRATSGARTFIPKYNCPWSPPSKRMEVTLPLHFEKHVQDKVGHAPIHVDANIHWCSFDSSINFIFECYWSKSLLLCATFVSFSSLHQVLILDWFYNTRRKTCPLRPFVGIASLQLQARNYNKWIILVVYWRFLVTIWWKIDHQKHVVDLLLHFLAISCNAQVFF